MSNPGLPVPESPTRNSRWHLRSSPLPEKKMGLAAVLFLPGRIGPFAASTSLLPPLQSPDNAPSIPRMFWWNNNQDLNGILTTRVAVKMPLVKTLPSVAKTHPFQASAWAPHPPAISEGRQEGAAPLAQEWDLAITFPVRKARSHAPGARQRQLCRTTARRSQSLFSGFKSEIPHPKTRGGGGRERRNQTSPQMQPGASEIHHC